MSYVLGLYSPSIREIRSIRGVYFPYRINPLVHSSRPAILRLFMKITVFPLLLATSALLVSCDSPAPKELEATSATTIELFNSTDLTGWAGYHVGENVSVEEVWSVRDGVLVCKGEPLGYLHTTDTSYTDFKLVVEWRWAPGAEPGNSGIFMRLHGEPQALPRCIEFQLKSGEAGDVFGFHGMKVAGEPERMKQIENHELGGDINVMSRIEGAEATPGEWNQAEITLKQGELKATINGTVVNRATGCEIVAGSIGLQSEGGEVHFRRVSLTPLP